MTQEEKDLVLRDLCSRLPYGVICQMEDKLIINHSPFYDCILSERYIELFRNHKDFYIKPYLRPLSSMTEEEEKEICQFMKDYNLLPGLNKAAVFCGEITDWLNKKMFDYRGLIPKDLAISTDKFKNMAQEDFIRIGETTTTGDVVSTKYKYTRCTHFYTISGLLCWCDKGIFPPDCATCTQGDLEEYLVEVTSTSTNKD